MGLAYVPLDECVDAKACHRMAAAIEKNRCRGGAVCDEICKFSNSDRPQWAVTLFATFAADLRGAACQVEFAHEQLCGFLGASPGVIEKQQQGVIAATLGSLAVWGCQERIHLWFIQIGDHCLAGFFERDGTDLTTPGNVFRTVLSHEARQRVNRSQPLVACGNRTLPRLFQVCQEEPHQIRRYIRHGQPVHGLVQFAGYERNHQGKGIAVTALRVAGQIAFGYQVFEQKTPHPGSQQRQIIHAVPPVHSAQSAGWLRAVVPVSG